MGLFALVTAGVLPMILAATKAGLVAKLDTGAKALVQERLEYARSLPFHLDNSASTGLDLLDQYYPAQSTQPAGLIAANGFTSAPSGWVSGVNTSVVTAGVAGHRLPSEPTTGPFFRVRYEPVTTDGDYTMYTTVQFLDSNKVAFPQANMVGYRSVDAAGVPVRDGTDAPPTSLIGLTVTGYWSAGQLSKKYDVFTEVAQDVAAEPLITAQGSVTAVQVSGTLDADRTATLRAGVLDVDGALSTAAGATVSGTGAVASITPDLTGTGRKVGASDSYSAPADGGLPAVTRSSDELLDLGLPVAGFGPTTLENLLATATDQPNVAGPCGTPDSCARAVLTTSSGVRPLSFDSESVRPAGLLLNPGPLVSIPATGGNTEVVAGRGFIRSTSTATAHDVTTAVRARAQLGTNGPTLNILPTIFAPDGVVQVSLLDASLTCATNGSAVAGPMPTYSASLRYWQLDLLTGIGAYRPPVLLSLSANDPLASLNRSAIPVFRVGGTTLFLSDYVQEWGSLTSALAQQGSRVSVDGNTVSNNIEGVLSVRTVPVRGGDAASGVSVRLGAMACTAEDQR